ncbi:prealbumin-like fold domain-containing protein [Kitasatospora sp. NPDC085879]|uniref:MSCRAMM family protein n=1 Tax=Kitasatospora sp. NPDC085879 TaxID=3154769 RepID=UPI0034274A7C
MRCSSCGRRPTAFPACRPAAPTRTPRSGRAGECDFTDLPLGVYYLREAAVPEGYAAPRTPVSGPYEVTAENAGQGLAVVLTNDRGDPCKGTSGPSAPAAGVASPHTAPLREHTWPTAVCPPAAA